MQNSLPVPDDFITDELRREGMVLFRYLIKSEPISELINRYIAANQTLFPSPKFNSDQRLIRCIARYPGFLPYIDAYSGFFKPKSLLRKKILIMLSIIETTPEFVESFRPLPFSKIQFMGNLISAGLSSAVKCLIGACLLPFIMCTK